MLQDLRTAFRVIARDRWLSAAAVTALALGIGVNATVFTLVNGVLIRGLPFPDSHNLYILGTRNMSQPGSSTWPLSYREVEDWREQSQSFTGIAAFSQISMNIADDTQMPEQQRGARVTVNAFRLLGVQPALGRDFQVEEGTAGSEPLVILGHTVWRNRYGGSADVIGKPIRLNGQQATIVGVLPEGMKFPMNVEIYTQIIPGPNSERREVRDLVVAARLREGVSRAEAQTEVSGIAARLAEAYPDTNKNIGAVVQTANERFNGGEIRTVFLAMLGAVGFVLLIACANVANLQLSRSIFRAREIAVRVALGATRWRIVRQLLVESVLLASIGGALGLLISILGTRMFDAAVVDAGKPYWIQFTVDYMVVAYLAAICVATGIIFGLVPALQISRTNVNSVLKEGGRGTTGGRRGQWLSGGMVVFELALTIVLLAGAGLMVRSFLKVYTADIGVPTENLMVMRLILPSPKYVEADTRAGFYDQLLPRLASIAGVDGAAVTTVAPGNGPSRRRMEVEGRPPVDRPEDRPEVSAVTVSPEFFSTVQLGVSRGRALGPRDGAPGAEAVVVNERFAAEHFAGEDPIGRRIRFPPQSVQAGQPEPAWRTIVGVSANIRHTERDEDASASVVYTPYRQEPPSNALLLVRSRLESGSVMHAVRREAQAVDPDQPVFTIQTFDQMRAQNTWGLRVFGTVFGIFALIAVVLASVGLYAVMAYSVTQRTQEIGVRMALGARGAQVAWLVLRRGLVQLTLGLAIGLAGAFGVSRVLASLLAGGVTAQDPLTFAAITALLAVVATGACLLPARRATRVDPLVALRD